MFSGIVEEFATVKALVKEQGNVHLTLTCSFVDELKIDRLFLAKGLDRERDDKIVKTVWQLAKDINVSVVQEGVENEEMFNRVVGMGCEVIQGYYYAKAISLEEYRMFLNTNTSIRYKAKVK